MTKIYTFPDGTKFIFEYNHNRVGTITLECMDILMSLLKATAEQTESQTDLCEHCHFKGYSDWCDTCRHAKTEPQTDTEIAKAIVHKMIDDAVIAEDAYPDLRQKMHEAVDEYEPQTDCAWK